MQVVECIAEKKRNNKRIDKGHALLLRLNKGMTNEEIGYQFGVSKQAVQQALKPFEELITPLIPLKEYAESREKVLSVAEAKFLASGLDPKKLKKSSALADVTCFGIVADKLEKIRNKGAGSANVFNIVINMACGPVAVQAIPYVVSAPVQVEQDAGVSEIDEHNQCVMPTHEQT